ncbi:D-alanine--D-alanine ligase [Bacteriovorax sp. DB6_IX]|uniref:D-alanine--D-alanine ligase n=1 Tax=Bacteriovorax sp. DB6_IX TaxID=1353530 RepID=UPI00038A2FDA|nr:D-alanine--D-alanine ligase [Bacteriovorax sp. DB6_IX]EQC50610.1 D-alanine--D-alanine ligase N-terminal domain protein [Bacteriovorax sp. DB6_IX]
MSNERKNILVLFGGGGTEHEVSVISSQYVFDCLKKIEEFNPILVEITKEGHWECQGRKSSLNGRILKTPTEQPYIDYVVPVIHGPPGETGEIQSYLKTLGIPFFGPEAEASMICFNKVTTKLWFDSLNIPNTPWIFANKYQDFNQSEKNSYLQFFKNNGEDVFVKAANQGSSVGCFHVTNEDQLLDTIKKAFQYSDNVLIEKTIKGRELEIAVYEDNGEIKATVPGEIICPDGFYSYEEKYSNQSHTSTEVEAKNLTPQQIESMRDCAIKAFKAIGLRHLSRIDFFVSHDGISLNEINTFPGMTPISMFPKMVENTGLKFEDYLKQIIIKDLS